MTYLENEKVEVWSESNQKWILGRISVVHDDGYVTVQYGDDLEKDLKQTSDHLRISNEDGISTQKEEQIAIHENRESEREQGRNNKPKRQHVSSLRKKSYYGIGMEVDCRTSANGSWKSGIVLDMSHDNYIKIQLLDGSTKKFEINGIKNIKQQVRPRKSILDFKSPKHSILSDHRKGIDPPKNRKKSYKNDGLYISNQEAIDNLRNLTELAKGFGESTAQFENGDIGKKNHEYSRYQTARDGGTWLIKSQPLSQRPSVYHYLHSTLNDKNPMPWWRGNVGRGHYAEKSHQIYQKHDESIDSNQNINQKGSSTKLISIIIVVVIVIAIVGMLFAVARSGESTDVAESSDGESGEGSESAVSGEEGDKEDGDGDDEKLSEPGEEDKEEKRRRFMVETPNSSTIFFNDNQLKLLSIVIILVTFSIQSLYFLFKHT